METKEITKMSTKNEIPISKEMRESLDKVGCELTDEQLQDILSDQQQSAAFLTLILFCIASGKTFGELPDAFWKE